MAGRPAGQLKEFAMDFAIDRPERSPGQLAVNPDLARIHTSEISLKGVD
ncbi:hypothetical protein [Leptolyngbya sp. 'hensonii']|nr:hypothetical protein [Leptolyngbya sp. 'hensonii']